MSKTPRLADFRRIVVKVGSSLLVDSNAGRAKEEWLASLAADIDLAFIEQHPKHGGSLSHSREFKSHVRHSGALSEQETDGLEVVSSHRRRKGILVVPVSRVDIPARSNPLLILRNGRLQVLINA